MKSLCSKTTLCRFLTTCLVGLSASFSSYADEFSSVSHDLYYGDTNGDGVDDIYLKARDRIIIIAGDIDVPLPIAPEVSSLLIQSSSSYYWSGYGSPVVNETVDVSGLTKANERFYTGNFNGDGYQDTLIRVPSSGHDSFTLAGSALGQVPAMLQQGLDTATGVSLANQAITIKDANNDGRDDIVLDQSGPMDIAVIAASGGQFGSNQVAYYNPTGNEDVGSTAGQFRVDESGSATYNIPIATAAGTAGVAPQISLNYSSQGGNGLAGKGWNISGLSGITRCRQTLQQDGAAKAITWSVEDRFCLDGQRLIKTSGSHGVNGATYKTEIDSFAKITAMGNVATSGSAYFKVERKDGSETIYGGTSNARQQNSSGQTLTWAQSQFEDSVGNAIKFSYLNDGNGQRIDKIYYAFGNSSSETSTTYLDFDYEGRVDGIRGYVAGHEFKTLQRLKTVKSINDGNTIREYNLIYKTTPTESTANKQSKLQSIQECSNTICLTPTIFNWSNDQIGIASSGSSIALNTAVNTHTINYKPVDINGDGMMDLVWLDARLTGSLDQFIKYAISDGTKLVQQTFTSGLWDVRYHENPGQEDVKLEVMDYNADGRMDVLVWGERTAVWKVYLSTPQGNGVWKLSSTPITTALTQEELKFSDIDSDGLVDAFYRDYYTTDTNNDGIPELLDKIQVHKLKRNTSPDSSATAYSFGNVTTLTNLEYGYQLIVDQPPADFNGDGKVDFIVRRAIVAAGCMYWCYGPGEYSVLLNDGTNTKHVITTNTELNAQNITEDIEFLTQDINGDGLPDVFFKLKSASQWYYKLNTGSGFGSLTSVVTWENPQFVDYNKDGYMDIAANVGSQLKARLWNPSSQSFGSTINIRSISSSSSEVHLFLDMNGDGASDYINFKSDWLYTYPNLGAHQARNVITKITNGLGADTDISYGSLSNSGHYERINVGTTTGQNCWGTYCWDYTTANVGGFYTALNGPWDIPTGSHTFGKGMGPVLELNGPIYVVTEAKSDAPVAGNAEAQSRISYHYAEAKIQASGRGFLGFQKIKSVDEQTGVETTTSYRQDFPFIGYPATTEVRSSQGKLLSEATNIWKLQGWSGSGAHANKYYQPYIASSTEKTYDLASNGTQAGSLLQTVTTTNTYDSYGNALTIGVSTTDGSDTFTKTTTNVYGSTLYEWEKGRLSRTTVVSTRPGVPSATRVSAFNYYTSADGTLEGLLKDEIIEPDNPAYKLTTSYEYDQFGNKIKATQSGQGVTSRFSESIYDTTGRYVNQTKNAYGQITETVVSRNAYGSPTAVQDINGVQTDFAYTPMGRQYWQSHASGAASTTLLDNPGSYCPGNAEYQSHTSDVTGGEGYECFDRLGRSIRKVAQGFDGRWIYSDTEYDNLGRVKRQSEPYYSGDSKHWTTLSYDILGRVISTNLPGVSTPATVAYTGFTTVTTNPKAQTKTETKNALGELVDVYDNLSGHLSYEYDAQGNLLKTTHHGSSGDSQNVKITMTYDTLGRKKTMDDPDKGVWTYDYNVFGELKEQIDAKGQKTTMTYDLLGRMDDRIDYKSGGSVESQTQWSYDNTTSGTTNRSALLEVKQSSTGLIDQQNFVGYMKAMTYDNLGRPSQTVTTLAANDDHYERVTYDQYGRTHQVYDGSQALDINSMPLWDNAIQNHYNSYGYLNKVTDAFNGQTEYYRVQEMDARGNVINFLRGNGITTQRLYDAATGRLITLASSSPLAQTGVFDIQDHDYDWDDLGNLNQRVDSNKNLTENFLYDGLNRLTSSQVVGEAAQTLTYNSLGNITYKSDVGTYTYGSNAGPHAVTSTSDGIGYEYDANGNMTRDKVISTDADVRSLVYSTFDKPTSITKGAHTTTFKYGPDRSRYLRTDINGSGTKTTRYIGSVEKITKTDGSQEVKRYLPGDVLITVSKDSAGTQTGIETQYLYKDHLGSMDVITDGNGTVIQELSFDTWGQRRATTDWTALTVAQLIGFDHSNTTRGFTGHEMLDEVGLIHMNGRIYDPRLARFMQADTFVDGVTNTQGFNRYSYTHNNPLNATDPTGHFVFTLAAMALAAAEVVTGFWAVVGMFAAAGFADALVAGASFGQALKSGFISGISAAAFSGIGEYLQNGYAGNFAAGLDGAGFAIKVAGHGIIGGITAELQGGSFGHGFAAAGFTALGSSFNNSKFIGGKGFSSLRVVIGAVIGGTASKLSGGKFANGAVTGAFSQALNNEYSEKRKYDAQKEGFLNKSGSRLREYIEEHKSLLGDQAKQFYETGMEALTTNVDKLLSGGHTYGVVFEGSAAAGVGLVGGGMFVVDQGGTSSYAFMGLEGGISIGASGTIGVVEYLGSRDGLAGWGGSVNATAALGLLGGEGEFVFSGGNSGGYVGWAFGSKFSLSGELTHSWRLDDRDF